MEQNIPSHRNPDGFIVLLDLDETLINQYIETFSFKQDNFALELDHVCISKRHYVWTRPSMKQFLEDLDVHPNVFQIWACSLGQDDWQINILKKIPFRNKTLYDFFDGHIFRSHIWSISGGPTDIKSTESISKAYNWDPKRVKLLPNLKSYIYEVLLVDDYPKNTGNVIQVDSFWAWGWRKREEFDKYIQTVQGQEWKPVFEFLNRKPF